VSTRPGLLAGTICGLAGVLIEVLAELSKVGFSIYLAVLLVSLAAGALGAGLLDRAALPGSLLSPRRERVRAAAIGGATATLWLGLLWAIVVGLQVGSGTVQGDIGGLLQQYGLGDSDAGTLQTLLIGCALCLYIIVVPAIGGALGALAGLIYSFVRPAALPEPAEKAE
jgi:hypothetical protein